MWLVSLGDASGSRVNFTKIIAILLHPDGLFAEFQWTWPIRPLGTTDHCGYLGVQAGSKVAVATNWDLAGAQLRLRIRLGSQITLTVNQRSSIAAAAIIPQLLYIGRNAWPDTKTVRYFNTCIRNFLWHGVFDDTTRNQSMWLNLDVMQLPRQDGHMALPDLGAELKAMAAITVSKRALSGFCLDLLAGDIFFPRGAKADAPRQFLTPWCSTFPLREFTKVSNPWRVGAMVVQTAGSKPVTNGPGATVSELLQVIDSVVPDSLVWTHGADAAVQRHFIGHSMGSYTSNGYLMPRFGISFWQQER
ncbi:hypothetical protein PC117_g20635 [Phytophthora cactorum]|uniref:Uncharacterized protein n=1 Tax=Phytophthora cactorum TaxID=29920 RepID=A0A8T1BL92_9STRA|nr:hypothetical protein PC117_g20635 [Phytophthora cactorum]